MAVQNLNFDKLDRKPGNTGEEVMEDLSVEDQENLDDFFRQMELQANGAIFDESALETNISEEAEEEGIESDSEPTPEPDEVGASEDYETLKKQYDDSSKEAKRLYEENQRLKEYEEYVPLLNVMQNDPGLIDHVRNYLSGNAAPVNIKEQLNIPEDFVFDFDEAVSDPRSDSGRLMGHYVDMAVSHRLNEYNSNRQASDGFEKARSEFREKNNLDDDKMNELENWAKQHQITWEDIFYLKNRSNREKELVRRTIEEREKQLRKMRGIPHTLAATGESVPPEVESVDEKMFKSIKQATEGGNIKF